jgi:hypothetical protein
MTDLELRAKQDALIAIVEQGTRMERMWLPLLRLVRWWG